MRSPRNRKQNSDTEEDNDQDQESSEQSEAEEEQQFKQTIKRQLSGTEFDKPEPKPRKNTGRFETELEGHSEQILGQMPDFERFTSGAHDHGKDRVPGAKKYPDQSFVNLGDSFS